LFQFLEYKSYTSFDKLISKYIISFYTIAKIIFNFWLVIANKQKYSFLYMNLEPANLHS
jgi:hypothetical protein